MAIQKNENISQRPIASSIQNCEFADSTTFPQSKMTASFISSSDVASYASEMLASLEKLANNNKLNVLGLMLAMARDQADDDAGRMETERAHAAL